MLFRRKRLHIGALICDTVFQKRSMRMRAGWPIVATILSVAVAYVAYPYVTLYRLGSAIQRADAATLESLVDWPAVREGIKEDVCDLASDDPIPKTGGALPPFGASFRRGIASSAIDQAVTWAGSPSRHVGSHVAREQPGAAGCRRSCRLGFFRRSDDVHDQPPRARSNRTRQA